MHLYSTEVKEAHREVLVGFLYVVSSTLPLVLQLSQQKKKAATTPDESATTATQILLGGSKGT